MNSNPTEDTIEKSEYSIYSEGGKWYLSFDYTPLKFDVVDFVYSAPVECDSPDLSPVAYRSTTKVTKVTSSILLPLDFDQLRMNEYVYLNGNLLTDSEYTISGQALQFTYSQDDGSLAANPLQDGDVVDFIYSGGVLDTPATPQLQSNWTETDVASVAFILNKPILGSAAATAATDYATAAQGSKADAAEIKLAGIEAGAQVNDPNTVVDATYVATDENFTTADHTKLDGIETGAEVNTVTSVNGSTGAVTVTTFSGDYGDLSNQPTIPTNNNELSNGAGYITDYTVTSADVIAHEGDITITESQISNLDTYLVAADITGKADLVGGKLDTSQIPDLAVTEYLGAVANETAMLALTGEKGDWCNRSDTGQMFIISGTDPTQLASWAAISYPASPVVSVAGKTGAVTLTHDDIGSGAVTATTGTYSGNVGIGTTSPTQKLDVVGTATFSSRVDANKFRSLSSGSASAPTICPGYDNDTGLFHPATNNIGFTTNGSEKMRIEAGGNVGIKQSSPDHLLHIGDTTNALGGTAGDQLDNLTIQSDTANTDYLNFTANRISTGIDWTTAAQRIQRKVDSTLMGYIQFGNFGSDLITFGEGNTEYGRFDGSGNFGIGTINPQQDLHVSGTTSFIRVEGTNNASGSDVAALEIKTFSARAGGVKGLDESDNELWFIGRHYNGGSAATRLDFDVAGSTAMSIPTDGNVGIGTISPQAKLDVRGNSTFLGSTGTATVSLVSGENLSGAGNKIAFFGANRSDSDEEMAYIRPYLVGNNGGAGNVQQGDLAFGTSGIERLRITSDGNTGIGTEDPQAKLDVNGSILSTPIAYSNNKDEAYLIAGTSGWTGATTNWNTFGFQHRIKTNNAGTPRVTIDTSGGEVFCVTSQHHVGIGTTSPTQELDVNGTIEANDLTINGSSFRNIPKNSKTAAYTLLVSDLGKVVCITTGGVTIPSGVFSSGDAVTIYNDSGSNQTITQGSSVTLRTAGTSNAGNKTLAGYGLCTVLCVASNVFVVGGAGLS